MILLGRRERFHREGGEVRRSEGCNFPDCRMPVALPERALRYRRWWRETRSCFYRIGNSSAGRAQSEGEIFRIEKDPGFFAALRMTQKKLAMQVQKEVTRDGVFRLGRPD